MRKMIFALPLLAVAACAPAATMEAETPVGDAQVNAGMTGPMMWSTTLQGQPGYEQVSGGAQAQSSAGGTGVSVSFAGMAMPGMTHTHPWHIHAGTCGSGGPIVGDPSAYPALQTAADGRATATATIQPMLEMGQSYYVNIHESPSELGTIVACGELQHAM